MSVSRTTCKIVLRALDGREEVVCITYGVGNVEDTYMVDTYIHMNVCVCVCVCVCSDGDMLVYITVHKQL